MRTGFRRSYGASILPLVVSVVLAIGFVVAAIYSFSQFEAKDKEIDDLLYRGDRHPDYAVRARTSVVGIADVLKETGDSRRVLEDLKAASGINDQADLASEITRMTTYTPVWKKSITSLNRAIDELDFQTNQAVLEIDSASRQLATIKKTTAEVENEFAAFRDEAHRMFEDINRCYQDILSDYEARIAVVADQTRQLKTDCSSTEAELTEIDLDTQDVVAKTGDVIDANQRGIDLFARTYRAIRFPREFEMVRAGFDGSIIFADYVRGVVGVDIGVLDNAPSNTVFAVFGTKPDGDPVLKGYIRLSVVTRPHTATGHIVQTAIINNPIRKGDRIASPFSPPGARFVIMERVVVVPKGEEARLAEAFTYPEQEKLYPVLPYSETELKRRIESKGGRILDDVNVDTTYGLIVLLLVKELDTSTEETEEAERRFLELEEKAISYNVPLVDSKDIVPFLK